MAAFWNVFQIGFYVFSAIVVLAAVIGAIKRFFGRNDWRDGEAPETILDEPLPWWNVRLYRDYLRFLWGLITFWK